MKSFLLCVSHSFCHAHSDNIFVIVLFHFLCTYIYLTSLSLSLFVAIFVPFFCSCSKHQNVVRQHWYDIFHYVYMYLDFFSRFFCEASHIHITLWISTLSLLFLSLFSPIPVFWSSFVINLYWCVFFSCVWDEIQTDRDVLCVMMTKGHVRRVCDLSSFCLLVLFMHIMPSISFFLSLFLFFLYVDRSSYFIEKVVDKLSQWDLV